MIFLKLLINIALLTGHWNQYVGNSGRKYHTSPEW